MALFFKKKKEEYNELPETEELPALPPLPGEEDIGELPPLDEGIKSKKLPAIPEISMPPAPTMTAGPVEKTTVFVRIDKYKEIMKTMQDMDAKIAELKNNLDKISAIKGKEAEIIDGWNAMLQDAKAKLDEITSKLTKPEA